MARVFGWVRMEATAFLINKRDIIAADIKLVTEAKSYKEYSFIIRVNSGKIYETRSFRGVDKATRR